MLEHDFILHYARTSPERQEIPKGLNWRYILHQAKFHNVAPLIYNNIKTLNIPPDVLKAFEGIYTYVGFHNMLYLEELKKILETGPGMIVLKGPMLAQDIYGNIALRPFVDMDLLVRKKDMDTAVSKLIDMGYKTEDLDFYKNYHFHLPLVKSAKMPVNIELHWAFVDRFILNKVNMGEVWENDKLSNEVNILYLLLHIEKHAFFNKVIYDQGNPRDWIFENPRGNQLLWYTDIYEIIIKKDIDWNRFIAITKRWNIQRIVYNNLYILNKLYPDSRIKNIISDMPHYRMSWVKKFFYIPAIKNKGHFKLSADMQVRPVRVLDLVDYLFPSPRVLKNHYCIANRSQVVVYYFMHFFRGLKEIMHEFIGICKKKVFIRS